MKGDGFREKQPRFCWIFSLLLWIRGILRAVLGSSELNGHLTSLLAVSNSADESI